MGALVSLKDLYTSPLDDVVEESDFSFELPATDAGEVLIVDDDPSSGAMNAAILTKVGYPVRAFTRPTEVLENLRDVPTVLVTDFDMPEMSGLLLAERVQEEKPGIKVIMLTGSGDEGTAQAALRMGISDYIRKPPDSHALLRSVQTAFHERAAEEYHRAMVVWMKEARTGARRRSARSRSGRSRRSRTRSTCAVRISMVTARRCPCRRRRSPRCSHSPTTTSRWSARRASCTTSA